MALWMEAGAEPTTEKELADLEAIQAIKESAAIEFKAYYRAAKAALTLDLLNEAMVYCKDGIEHDPANEEMKRLLKVIEAKKSEIDRHKLEVDKAVKDAERLVSAFDSRGYKLGKATYQELTGLRKPVLDESGILHWPVLLLYAEVMSSDFIEDFCETDMFSDHLDIMFSESSPLPWDAKHNYTRDAIELYYEAGSGVGLEKKKLMHYLLQGTVASNVADFAIDDNSENFTGQVYAVDGSSKWVKVNKRKTLHEVLKASNFIIPGIPVFYVVSRRSTAFYQEFKAGRWMPPA